MNSMVAQVDSIPQLIQKTFQTLDKTAKEQLSPELILSLKRIYITGCGDSHHAGLTTQYAFEKLTGLPTHAATALEFARYRTGFLSSWALKTNLVIGISVSGSVARTFEALQLAKNAGGTTLSLTATPDSRVGQAGDILFKAPLPPFELPEGEVSPGVRSFFINQMALLLMALRIGEVNGTIDVKKANDLRKELLGLADVIEETIQNNRSGIQELVNDWQAADEFVFVGGGPNFGTALFSAAKVLEASGDSALGQDTEEWAHLQYFQKKSSTPTFFITAADRDLSRMGECLFAARQIGRRTAVICPESEKALIQKADSAFNFPRVKEIFSSLVTQIPGELFAAYRAEVIDEPFFRNFTGGRDVENGGGISRIRTSETWETWKE